MKNNFLLLIILAVCFTSCQSDENDPFLITSNQVGPIKKDLRINQLDSVFPHDSIVTQTSGAQELRSTDEIKIFEKGGTQLLALEPFQEFDSTSTIGYIRIYDSRYKTQKGLNSESTFEDIIENYNISRIENTLNAAVVFIDEINAYITIDKKELPSSLRYDTDTRIRANQIPDKAPIKYFMIHWD